MSKIEESSSKWPKTSLQVLHKLWSEYGTLVQFQQEGKGMLSIGQVLYICFQTFQTSLLPCLRVILCLQLVDMQWKLGMAVSSDTCRSLNSPYVTLLLKVADPSGHICQKSFEMTIPQFQVCKSCNVNANVNFS